MTDPAAFIAFVMATFDDADLLASYDAARGSSLSGACSRRSSGDRFNSEVREFVAYCREVYGRRS